MVFFESTLKYASFFCISVEYLRYVSDTYLAGSSHNFSIQVDNYESHPDVFNVTSMVSDMNMVCNNC